MIAVDSSGNGNDGTYSTDLGRFARFVGGLVPGDRACDFTNSMVTLPVVPTQWTYDWTVEVWLRGTDDVTPTVLGTVYYAAGGDLVNGVAPGQPEDIFLDLNNGVQQIALENGRLSTYWGVDEGVPNDGNAHHLVVTYSPHAPAFQVIEADVAVYLDGSSLTVTAEGVVTEPVGPDELKMDAFFGGIAGTPQLSAVVDEFAVYPSILSSGDVYAHYAAASTSFAAYTAAVLANSPTVYYHLNDGTFGWYVGQVGMAS